MKPKERIDELKNEEVIWRINGNRDQVTLVINRLEYYKLALSDLHEEISDLEIGNKNVKRMDVLELLKYE